MRMSIPPLKQQLRSVYLALPAAVLAIALVAPLLLFGNVYAAGQLTQRSVAITTAVPSASSTWTLSFQLGTAGQVQGIKIAACDTALGTCNSPGAVFASATYGSQSNWTGATNFAKDATGANDCTAGTATLCLNRTDTTSETAGGTAKTIVINSATNVAAANTTWFLRLTTYSTNTYTAGSIVDQGTVAASTSQTLTVNAAIQEVLVFCIGATAVNDATTSPGADCSAISGTAVDLGTLDSSIVSVTPVAVSSGGSNTNGVAMMRTNAVNGATVSYRAVQQTGTNHQGTLRVSGASCNVGNINTDQCIDAQGATQATFTAGTEKFGMTVAGTNCGAVTSYSCALASGTNNLKASTNYIGASAITFGNSSGFAWDESGTAQQIASSSTVVDNEALILKFAATPSITTPTGSYTAQSDFIAVATY